MAAPSLLNDGTGSPGDPPVISKARRASYVIQQTEQLLDGLHADAQRSDALIAELELLLLSAASHSQRGSQAPSETRASCDEPLGVVATIATEHFTAVQPLQVELSDEDDGGDGSIDDEYGGDVAQEEEASPQAAPPATPSTASTRRRSSVITFDGTSLFGGQGLAAGASGQRQNLPSGSDYGLMSIARMSLSRGGGSRGPVPGRSWTEGRPNSNMSHGSIQRRSVHMESNGPAPLVQVSGYSYSSPASALVHNGILGRFPSSTLPDEPELVGRSHSYTRGPRTPSNAPLTSGLPRTPSGLPPSVFQTHLQSSLLEDGPAAEAAGPAPDAAHPTLDVFSPSGGSDASERQRCASPAPSGARGGRFMKALQGIFKYDQVARSAPQTLTGFGQPASSSGQPLSPSGSSGATVRSLQAAHSGPGTAAIHPLISSNSSGLVGDPDGLLRELQRRATSDSFTVARRFSNVTSTGASRTQALQHRASGTFNSAVSAPAAGGPNGAGAPGGIAFAKGGTAAAVCSLSAAGSLAGGAPPPTGAAGVSEAHAGPPSLLVAEGRPVKGPAGQRATACTLPQII
ncbi:hypothetical protein GPECTOR_50g654 [Gonium pectorale]|uniref:Uncharacterized protein n=1 Tax=Gonium pectorale TaxID=33097 RepID=A0A150G924_GONPE|nr:hypothetical protein GPECTOR_50g654 [Gonium pectorale]|eukprot:KXZ45860.1 hypothetical protein GPECTOR_50g654 [Gonium pectorale]